MAHPFFLTPTSKQTLYYYNNSNNEPVGPLALEKLREMFQTNQLGPHVWVIEKGGSDWNRLADLLASHPIRTLKKAPLPQIQSPVQKVEVPSHVPAPPFVAAQKHVEPAVPKQEPLYISRSVFDQPETAPASEPTQAPMAVQIIAVLSFLSGFANIFVGLTWAAAGVFFLKANLLISLIPAAYGIVAGIYNIIFASKLLSMQPCSKTMARYLALLDIGAFSFLNVISCVVGLINLFIAMLSPQARAHFANTSNS